MTWLQPGDRVGEWIVEEALGEGGMGAVYRAHSTGSTRVKAALKVLKPSDNPDAASRFVREAEALSALSHQSIVRVMGFSHDRERNLPYLVMELAPGETLKARLLRGPLSLAEALAVFRPLASGLEHAHAAGIWHRDIKPANVVLCTDGTVRLVDFGIAAAQDWEALTSTGHMGTPAYLPPEVFRGERADPRHMDVYGLGLLLWESLTGTRAFAGASPEAGDHAANASIGVRKLQQQPLDPGPAFPEALRDLVRRATHPDPAQRPTVAALRRELDALSDGPAHGGAESPTVRVPEPTPRAPSRAASSRTWAGQPRSLAVALAAPVVLGLVLLAVLLPRRHPAAPPAAAQAPAEAVRRNDRDGLDYVRLPPGRFVMGCTEGAACPATELPQHDVTIARPLWMARTEVTVDAFRRFAQATSRPLPPPPRFNAGWEHADHPVVGVPWREAREYCAWAGGRLPSEAELEYAARAGAAATTFPWGEEPPVCERGSARGARFGRCEPLGTEAVGSFAPNGYGLVDLLGNVWEWAEDEWHDTLDGAPSDGSPWGSALGHSRVVLRGGGWNSDAPGLRASVRDWVDASTSGEATGFRCVVPDPGP